MLHAQNLTLTYQDGDKCLDAVHELSFTLHEHQFVGILGPSGSGKSSLLYLLSGLRQPTKGEICFEGRPYRKMSERERADLRRQTFGFVFQQHFLISYLTVLENALATAPTRDKRFVERAQALLAELGLGDKLHRFPYELSGGERQRVAVARSAVHMPRVIFADEPTGLLDQRTGLQVISAIRQVVRDGSLVAVTHNPEILDGADVILTMRDGAIVNTQSKSRQTL